MNLRSSRNPASSIRGVVPFQRARRGMVLATLLWSACVNPIDGAGPDAAPQVGAATQALSTSPDLLCTGRTNAGHDYWFCPTPRGWQDARSKCLAIGYDLIAVDSSAENQFVASNTLGSAWIGASDSAQEGVWRWISSGNQFWQGKSSGSTVAGAYTNWRAGQPDDLLNQDCAQFQGGLGGNKWSDESCGFLAGFICEGDACPNDPAKTEPGQCGCGVPDTDADADGTADCRDQCPNDAAKTDPGACGCGAPELDSDGDGVLDCDDQCPNDPVRILSGQCGCGDAPAAAGTACTDGLCAANDHCDGTGNCGAAAQCGAPDGNCRFEQRGGEAYWFCDNLRNQVDARQRCQNVGMDLALVDDAGENDFIASTVHGQSFLGGADTATEGQWLWLHTNAPFWTGGAGGSAVNGAFTNWDVLQPSNLLSNSDCLAIGPLLLPGKWDAIACNSTHGYVCERIDLCPFDPDKLEPGVCGCGVSDADSDADGTLDCLDPCPTDPDKVAPGVCGCGVPDIDTDQDGTQDCLDGCPSDPGKVAPLVCGCGVPDVDSDGDNTLDCEDACPSDPNKTDVGVCGCNQPDTDTDNDGAADCVDACPNDPVHTTLGKTGCADTLDQQGRELIELKRASADPDLPAGERPTSGQVKLLAYSAQQEALQIIDNLPDDFQLRPTSDLAPYVATLGRALSTLTMVGLPPLGHLPDGQLCSDRLERTSADPSQPLLSALFSHLPYQDDDEEMTRALYALTDYQHLLHCLTRSELARLDAGLTRALETVLHRLVSQNKSMLALAFFDQSLPLALLTFDAAKVHYTPRVYRWLSLRKDLALPSANANADDDGVPEGFFTQRDLRLRDSVIIRSAPYTGSALHYLYCEQPAKEYTLSRFGIWLEDTMQGGRLNRARLGSVTPCAFLERITDLSRLGAGDCSLLEVTYSGYRCPSPRTCQLAAPDAYRFGVRPGSSLSKLNQFGVAKAFAAQTSCGNDGFTDGLSGYGTQRPGTECLITGDDLIAAAQDPFIECLASSQQTIAIEPPPDPWNDRCTAVDCAEGEQCEPNPPEDSDNDDSEAPPSADTDGDGDTDEDGCDAACEAKQFGSEHKQEAVDTFESTFGDARCPGCLQSGWQAAVEGIIDSPPQFTVNEHVNLNPDGLGANARLGNTRVNDDHSGLLVELDDDAIRQVALDRAADRWGLPDAAACAADTRCAQAANDVYYPLVHEEALDHEYGHVLLLGAIASGSVFTDAAVGEGGYFQIFNYQWEELFEPGACKEDPVTCSAQHEWINNFLARIAPPGRARDCGIEGSCNDTCGPTSPSKYELCSTLADLVRDEYKRRIQPVCPPPAPNQTQIEPSCRFQGCFGDGIPTTRSACPFAQCTGSRQLGTDIACDCCAQCTPGPIIGTGVSPSCQSEPDCQHCCRWCEVAPAAECPPVLAPLAPEQAPAWQISIGPD